MQVINLQKQQQSVKHLLEPMEAPSQLMMQDLEDMVKVSVSFERLQGVIRFLAQSQKGLTSNINQIFKQMSAIDK